MEVDDGWTGHHAYRLGAAGLGGTSSSGHFSRVRRSGSSGHDGDDGGLQMDGSGGGGSSGSNLEAPTTLQAAAPRREAVASAEVVGLLAAVIGQRKN